MKRVPRPFALLAILLLCFALVLPTRGQAPQPASAPTRSDSENTKEPAKSDNPAATTPSSGTASNGTNDVTPRAKSPTAQKTARQPKETTVWVNTATGVYHKRGSRWYGKTKKGKYMTEADAIRAGYKAAGTE